MKGFNKIVTVISKPMPTAHAINIELQTARFRFFQNLCAKVTHGAKNGGSFSEMMGPNISN